MTGTAVNNQGKANTSQDPGQAVRCLAVPLHGDFLLSPHTAVAEVTQFKTPEPVPHAPNWLMGLMRWRGIDVPLVTFERFAGGDPNTASTPERVVIFNTLNGNPHLPFVALAARGIPRLAVVAPDELHTLDKAAQDGPLVLRRVKLNDSEFIIPDFDALEQTVLRLGM